MINLTRVSKYSDKILNIIDNRDDFTRSDLQGVIEAIVIDIISVNEKSKVDVRKTLIKSRSSKGHLFTEEGMEFIKGLEHQKDPISNKFAD